MLGDAVLAIDQGTSATKAVVTGLDGSVLALAECPIDVVARPDGSVEFDPIEMWNSVLTAARDAHTAAGTPRLAAIGLGNQGETILAWDRRTGEPLSKAMVWQDRRSLSVCNAIRSRDDNAPARLEQLTGLTLDPYFVAPKLVWMRDQLGLSGTTAFTDRKSTRLNSSH